MSTTSTTVAAAETALEFNRSLLMIQPDIIDKTETIIDRLNKEGYYVIQKRRLQLTSDQAGDLCVEHYNKAYYSNLISYMSSGPVMVMVLMKSNALNDLVELVGPEDVEEAQIEAPTSLRAIYGTKGRKNGLYVSKTQEHAQKDIRYFFPMSVLEPLPNSQEARKYLAQNVNPTLMIGLTQLCKTKPKHAVLWLANWLLENNPVNPKIEEPAE